jgi:hypothetical protein
MRYARHFSIKRAHVNEVNETFLRYRIMMRTDDTRVSLQQGRFDAGVAGVRPRLEKSQSRLDVRRKAKLILACW